MGECSSGMSIVVNAEMDFLGDIFDGGAGTYSKASPRQTTIEKAHSVLRQEFDGRNERRREIDFLENGGNLLDFKLGQADSVSAQSTSHTDQKTEHTVSSVAKVNFPSTASSVGDSIESNERRATGFESTGADNLLLFELENELTGKERNSAPHIKTNNISSCEKSSQRGGSKKAKESKDLGKFRPYARRNRSKSNSDGTRSNSTNSIPPGDALLSSIPSRHSLKDTKGLELEINDQKDESRSSLAHPKNATTNVDLRLVGVRSDNMIEVDLYVLQECSTEKTHTGVHEDVLDVTFAKDIKEKEGIVSASVEFSRPHVTLSNDNENSSGELKEIIGPHRDKENLQDEVQTSVAAITTKNIEPELSCTQSNICLVRNNHTGLCNNTGNADEIAKDMDNVLALEETENPLDSRTMVKEYDVTIHVDSGLITNDDYDSSHQNRRGDESLAVKEMLTIESGLQKAVFSSEMEVLETTDPAEPNNKSGPDRDICSTVKHQDTIGSSICEFANAGSSRLDSVDLLVVETHDCQQELPDKAQEDSILEKARNIEERKRIAELSVHTVLSEKSQKCHWDFVLEEMAWLANDVAQERLWKMAAASNISNQVALTSRSKYAAKKLIWNQKKVAFTLAKAVLHFWRSLQELTSTDGPIEATKAELQHGEDNGTVKGYSLQFLKCTGTDVPCTRVEAPLFTDSTSESLDEEELPEESLVYPVSLGAMETYRKYMESCLIQLKKSSSSATEVDTSMYDAAEELSHGNAYDVEKGETSMYYNPGSIEDGNPTKFTLKKRKNPTSSARSYEPEADCLNGHCKIGSNQTNLIRKRPATDLNTRAIPTKRVHTATNQRFPNSFSAESIGGLQAPNKTDGSSEDTNSFQDDQSTFHSGTQLHKSVEAESGVAYSEKTLPYDEDTTAKPKKKNSTYDRRWHPDSVYHNEQRVNIKKRMERHLLDYNESGPIAKKPKMTKHSLDNTFDHSSPRNGSIPSSQMSHMSNTNKFMKLIGGRGWKSKIMKISTGQTGPGNPWSLYEDQALVVLVHDMGPNWELVSDAINSTLQFKCIFRKAIECKERHKNLMDRTAADEADSAEDTDSSQPYPSALPSLPKGRARQLFQRLLGPMEEATLMSHFEKIILISQSQCYHRSQRDNQAMKQIAPVHNSHAMALFHVCPNNPSGNLLTPLDFCDVSGTSPDVIPHGYEAP